MSDGGDIYLLTLQPPETHTHHVVQPVCYWFYWELPSTTTVCYWFYWELPSTTTVLLVLLGAAQYNKSAPGGHWALPVKPQSATCS